MSTDGLNIEGSVALVTGANRGIGRATVEALLAQGAAKVYAGCRDAAAGEALAAELGDKVQAVALDITSEDQVNAAAATCADVNVLINNAGVNFNRPALGETDRSIARTEMDVNYHGTLDMCRAFGPVLGANGGGAMVNLLSILARVNLPAIGSYCASKAAAHSLTQAVRAQLRGQGTLVVGAMPGAVDTRLTEGQDMPKMTPAEVASAILGSIESGTEEIYPGDMASGVAAGLAADPQAVEAEFGQMLPG